MEILEFRSKVQELEAKGLHKSKLFYELCKECNLTAEELKDHLKQLPNFDDYSGDFYDGIDAVVVQGDTLADPYCGNYPPERTFRTPKNMGMLI